MPRKLAADNGDGIERQQSEQGSLLTIAQDLEQVALKPTPAKSRLLIAAGLALVSCLSAVPLEASEPAVPNDSTIQRSMRVVPRRYIIVPSGPSVAANQTQHFGVVDSQGRPVAVRWNISGLGCYGSSCGNIDADGVYHAPDSLPRRRVVTLEGVVVADPHFSVLTQITLDGPVASPDRVAGQAPAEQSQPVAPQVSDREQAKSESMVKPVAALAAVPSIDATTARTTGTVPTPSVVASAPTIEKQEMVNRTGTMPVPPAVGNSPSVGTVTIARASDFLPLPSVVGAAPLVNGQDVARRPELPAVPSAVAATPSIGKQESARSASLPLPSAVSSSPSVGKPDITSRVGSVPVQRPVNAPPKASADNSPRTLELIPTPTAVIVGATTTKHEVVAHADSAPKAVSAAPATQAHNGVANPLPPANSPSATSQSSIPSQNIAPRQTATNIPAELGRGTPAVIPAPAANSSPAQNPAPVPAQSAAVKGQPLVMAKNLIPPGAARPQSLAGVNGSMQPGVLSSSLSSAANPAPTLDPTQNLTRVTYHNGQLTIDATNATLADVLKAVAQKTGATIDVPPGTGMERVAVHAGPGTANDVLSQLLNGSHFNFILVNSSQRPDELAQVLLSVQREDSGPIAPAAAEPKPATAALYQPQDKTVAFQPMPPQYDGSMKAPPEGLSGDALGEVMKEKAKELREKASQQNPQ